MYKIAALQAAWNLFLQLMSVCAVLTIAKFAQKADYGEIALEIATVFIAVRVTTAGTLVLAQRELSAAMNQDRPICGETAASVLMMIAIAVFLFLTASLVLDIFQAPIMALLLLLSTIGSTINLALKQWMAFRLAPFCSELVLLASVFLWREKLNFDSLISIYEVYYGVASAISLGVAGVAVKGLKFGRFKLNRLFFLKPLTLTLASFSSITREKLVIFLGGRLMNAEAVADLAYLLLVFKSNFSLFGTFTSVKFVFLSGLSGTLNTNRVGLFAELLVFAVLSAAGYLLLWAMTPVLGMSVYLSAFSTFQVLLMVLGGVGACVFSIWYNGRILSDKIGQVIYVGVIFAVALISFWSAMPDSLVIEPGPLFFVVQVMLVLSIPVARLFDDRKN